MLLRACTFRTEPKLCADYSGIIFIPLIITYGSPASSNADLHSTMAAVSPNQANCTVFTYCVIG